jgi:hypothetical protein
MKMTPREIVVLDAVTETTTSSAQNIENACKVTFLFTRANHSAGSSAFVVSGSFDGTTYVNLNLLISNVANTNAQTLTRVGTVTLSSNTSVLYALDLENYGFKFIKVTVTETTDGTHTCKMFIQ